MSRRSSLIVDGSEIVFVDSITQIIQSDAGKIVVSGSHGGISAASFAVRIDAQLYVFNDAGIGKNSAGVSGLALLEQNAIAAIAVAHHSAEIGSATDTYENGIVSVVNDPAVSLGFRVDDGLSSQLAEFASVRY